MKVQQVQKLQHPNAVLRGNNKLTLDYLEQVKKCVDTLTEMGLNVINIHFEKIKPIVRVATNVVTQKLEKTEFSFCYYRGNDGKRFGEYQMMVEGIKVVWRSYLN